MRLPSFSSGVRPSPLRWQCVSQMIGLSASAAKVLSAAVAMAEPPATNAARACRRFNSISSIAALPQFVQRFPVGISGGPEAPKPSGVTSEDLRPIRLAEERDLVTDQIEFLLQGWPPRLGTCRAGEARAPQQA